MSVKSDSSLHQPVHIEDRAYRGMYRSHHAGILGFPIFPILSRNGCCIDPGDSPPPPLTLSPTSYVLRPLSVLQQPPLIYMYRSIYNTIAYKLPVFLPSSVPQFLSTQLPLSQFLERLRYLHDVTRPTRGRNSNIQCTSFTVLSIEYRL